VTQIATWMQDPYASTPARSAAEPADRSRPEAGGGRARHAIHDALGPPSAGLAERCRPTRWTGCWRWAASNFARASARTGHPHLLVAALRSLAGWFLETEARLRTAGRRAILTEQRGL